MTWCIVVVYWLVGLTWALVVGHFGAWAVVKGVRAYLPAARPAAGDGIPAWLTGIIERLFFTTAVALESSGAAPAMMAWMAIKLAANWNRAQTPPPNVAAVLSAVLGGLVSMFFA